jgi:hypothetical protein
MSRPYWEVEKPQTIVDGNKVFSYYEESKVLEIASLIRENGITKEIRRQSLSADKLRNNADLVDVLLELLEAAGAIQVE